MISTLISTVAVCTACGLSPLLNHTAPQRTPVINTITIAAIETPADVKCRLEFQTQNLCADYVWIQEPNRDDNGAMKLYFWSKAQPGTFSNPADLQVGVKLWMASMGHGSQKVKMAQAKAADGTELKGVFDATEIFFVMGGDWEIQFQLKDAAGKVVETLKVPYHAL